VSRIRRVVLWPRPCGCASLTTGRTGPARGRKRKGSPHWRPQEARWRARPRRSMAFPRSVRLVGEAAPPESAAFGDQAPRATAAWRDSRPDSARSSDAATPAHGGCHDRNPRHRRLSADLPAFHRACHMGRPGKACIAPGFVRPAVAQASATARRVRQEPNLRPSVPSTVKLTAVATAFSRGDDIALDAGADGRWRRAGRTNSIS
jgi:hypothetical protein